MAREDVLLLRYCSAWQAVTLAPLPRNGVWLHIQHPREIVSLLQVMLDAETTGGVCLIVVPQRYCSL